MVRSLLIRGLLAGLLAGLAAFLAGSFVGELHVDRAIEFEEAQEADDAGAEEPAEDGAEEDHDHDEASVSRTLQKGPGLLTATLGYGLAMGGLFALVYAGTVGRLGRFGHRASAGLLGLGAFVSVVLVPFLKYPANPPAVGNPDTVNSRTVYFFAFIVISVALAVAAVWLVRTLIPRWGTWNAWIAAVAGYVAAVVLAGWLMPVVDDVPEDFPATLLWDFRVASLVLQVVLWAVLALAFGYLVERSTRPRVAHPPAADRTPDVPAT